MMLFIETGLVLLALLLALIWPEAGAGFFSRIEVAFNRLARRRTLSVLLVGAATLALRAAFLPIMPVPEPIVHDEFGYLLAADTFAHGRLSNPTHPMWMHFETFAELQQPTYQCFAPPAQGLLLAAGKVFLGHPFWGVWLSAGAMCAAICWMLQAWLPARWALLGGLLAILRFAVFGYWADSYWGGALSAAAGALVLGSLPRIKRYQRPRDAIILGLGLAILANNRPYEGVALAVPVLFSLAAWIIGQNRPAPRTFLPRVVLPLTLLFVATLAAMGYYFWRVTGAPLRTPYQIERETYAVAPYMLWQSPRTPPAYHHAIMQRMYVNQEFLNGYRFARTAAGFVMKSVWAWSFYLGPALTFPIFMLAFALPYGLKWGQLNPRVRFLLLASVIALGSLALETFFHPHYAAPFTGLLIALIVFAMRTLQRWRWHGRPTGLFVVRAVPAVCAIMFVLRAVAGPLHIPLTPGYTSAWHESAPPSVGRQSLQSRLEQLPGRQLVIVNYSSNHGPFHEWVYNAADIDNSRVVWARGMGADKDSELLRYFHDRQIWLLEPDYNPPKLTAYPMPSEMTATR